MRIRGLQARARPFRYAGFWLIAVACLLLIDSERSPWQVLIGCLFCIGWPMLVDRCLTRWHGVAGGLWGQRLCYLAECALVALVLGWVSLAPLPAMTTVLWLLGGAAALAGWPLALAGSAAIGVGAGLGQAVAPVSTRASTPSADLLALAMLAGFVLALGLQSFRQARRLDVQRLLLARRSAELERVNGRLQRYLPVSVRDRVRQAPDEPWRWERRWLTVVFIDLAGFTELAERLDAEALATLVDDYFGALIPAVDAHGGEVSKLLGDGVLAVFGSRASPPGQVAPEQARRAIAGQALALCLEAPALIAAVARRWRDRGERLALAMRAGIASGLCTLGDRGGSDRLDFTVIGTPVNLASRLQARATENGTLLDEATGLLCAPSQRLSGPHGMDIEGIGTVAVYRPGGPPDVRPGADGH
jgi:adenylate cyclase